MNIYFIYDIAKYILKISIILSLFLVVPTYAVTTRKCTISFSAKGGTGTMEKMEATKGSTIKINPCTYIKDGYYFKGWEDDMGHTYDDQGYIVVDTDKHLYALWSKSGDSNDPQIVKTSNDEKILKDISEYQKKRRAKTIKEKPHKDIMEFIKKEKRLVTLQIIK